MSSNAQVIADLCSLVKDTANIIYSVSMSRHCGQTSNLGSSGGSAPEQLELKLRQPSSFLQPFLPLLAATGIQPTPVIGARRVDQNLQQRHDRGGVSENSTVLRQGDIVSVKK